MRRSVRRRKGVSKERIIMAASSVIVLGALTATGLWMRGTEEKQKNDYVVDLSAIENDSASSAAENEIHVAENVTEKSVTGDDLDYDPYFQETNSAKVENPDQSESDSMSDGAKEAKADKKTEESKKTSNDILSEEENTPAISTAMQPALTFSDSDTLVWPVVGNILVNYSMDKTIYFPTLDQYKYNPAIIIQANVGDLITAAAAGKVTEVFSDPQIGNAVTVELGNGYEATYGQLANVLVSEGSYVALGDIIAEVAAPTKYYSTEGTNVYFKLTKDGEPVNPMTKLN